MIEVHATPTPQLVSRIQPGDKTAACDCGSTFIWRAGTDLVCPVCRNEVAPEHAATITALAELDRTLITKVVATNQGEKTPMQITDASKLAQSLRDEIGALKKEVSDANGAVGAAINDMRDSVGAARGVAKALTQEAADLRASVGLNTNSPPGS